MTVEEKLEISEALLKRFADACTDRKLHDETLWKDYFQYTGQHMILTDEGWYGGEMKQSYIDEIANGNWGDATLDEFVFDEINAPS